MNDSTGSDSPKVSFVGRILQNIAISLSATGNAAVLIAWILAVVAVALWAPHDNADKALNILFFMILGLIGTGFYNSTK